MRINLEIALLASAGLWVASGIFECNLPSYTDASGWLFDPFAWQFLFSLGAISANAASPDGPLRPRSRWLFCIATAYLLLGLLVAAPWTKIPGWDGARALPDFRHEVSKQYLSAWRLAGILASSVPPQAAWLRRRWAQLLISCGQNSLPVFCLSIVLSLTGFVILVEGSQNWLLRIAVNAGGIAVLCFAAWKLRQLKRARRKDEQAAAAPAQHHAVLHDRSSACQPHRRPMTHADAIACTRRAGFTSDGHARRSFSLCACACAWGGDW
jgi:hypothetical protein